MKGPRIATNTQIRNHFKAQGHTVQISRDGHVFWRRGGEGPWLDGRWTEEYAYNPEDGVYFAPLTIQM